MSYLEGGRYQNAHSGIFLAAFLVFLGVLGVRYTLWSFFISVYQSCFRRFKAFLRPEKELSEDVYQEMSLKHLLQEYEKTKEEVEAIES